MEKQEQLRGLLAAHDYVCREIKEAEIEMDESGDRWTEGHLNGLKEGRNRVEQAILEVAEDN